MHILRCMGSKFCVKFQRAPLKFHTKFWTHIPQNMHFTVFKFCVWFAIYLNCDVINLSETCPCSLWVDKGIKYGNNKYQPPTITQTKPKLPHPASYPLKTLKGNQQLLTTCILRMHILGRELGPSAVFPNQSSRWKLAFLLLKHV